MNQSTETPVTIIVDDREQKSEVLTFLAAKPDVQVVVRRLLTGDYLAENRILFERKTLQDFAVSIIDGRLFKQALALVNNPYKGALILEGGAAELSATGVRREALQGALISISLILGIPVLRALTPAETADLMVYAARKIQGITGDAGIRHGYRPKTKKARQIYILQGLPGIGPERAALLLKKFGNIERIIAARPEELQEVKGIGKNVAAKIKWAVSEQVSTYGSIDLFLV